MRIAIASSYGLPGREVERAFDLGVRSFFWGALRHGDFGTALKTLARRDRTRLELITVSYATNGLLVRGSVDLARRRLGVDSLDVLVIGYVHDAVPPSVRDAAIALREKGIVKSIGVSSHERPLLARLANESWVDLVMARYSAAHRGAVREVFPHVAPAKRVITYTATRWGTLLDRSRVPAGENVPTATDCYRYVLANPRVDRMLAGPATAYELDGAIEAARLGAMEPDRIAWMERVGDAVRAGAKEPAPPRDGLRRLGASLRSLVTRGVTEDVISRWNR